MLYKINNFTINQFEKMNGYIRRACDYQIYVNNLKFVIKLSVLNLKIYRLLD